MPFNGDINLNNLVLLFCPIELLFQTARTISLVYRTVEITGTVSALLLLRG